MIVRAGRPPPTPQKDTADLPLFATTIVIVLASVHDPPGRERRNAARHRMFSHGAPMCNDVLIHSSNNPRPPHG